MRKILSLVLGLLWTLFSISANAACNLYTTTNSSAGYIDANGVVHDTGGYLATDYISITPSTEYTVYARMTSSISGHGIRIAFYDTNKQFIAPREGGEAVSSGQYIYNLTSPANAKYIRMSTSENSSVVVDRTIVQGRYSLSTIPTNMSACANALDPCRNLFDKDAEYINAYVNANSGVLTRGDSQYSFVIPVQPNTKYTLSGMSSGSSWGSFADNSIGATATSKLAGNGTLTTGANDKYLIGLAYASGTQYDYRQTLQIEEGDVATEYVPYCKKIKIATTKYNESAFSPLNTALQNAISVVDTVVSNTITQAGRIATLQAQKQTRPNDIADDNEKCPAGKKCLLVEDASGTPHWYEIVTIRLPDGYTELQYIESTGTQYIDTGIVGKSIVGIEYDFTILNDITVGSSLFGTRLYGNVGSGINFGHSADGKVTVDFFDGYRYTSNLSFEKNTPYRLVVQNNKYTLYNAITGAALDWHTFNATTSDLEYVAVLFGLNNGGSISAAKDSVKVTSCKIYTTNGIVDLVPAKNADGKIGMYDLANGVFYENAGTGEFIAGDPVVE